MLAVSIGPSGCDPAGTGGVVLALYDRSSSNTCIASSADNAGATCAAIAYQVTAADVKSSRTFLVRVSLFHDGGGLSGSAPMFPDNTLLRVSLSDCSPVDSPSPTPAGTITDCVKVAAHCEMASLNHQ